MYNSLKGFIKKWGETTRVKNVGRNDWGLGAKRLGCRGETSRHQIWGETTRGEATRGELVLGRNDLLPLCGITPMKLMNLEVQINLNLN